MMKLLIRGRKVRGSLAWKNREIWLGDWRFQEVRLQSVREIVRVEKVERN